MARPEDYDAIAAVVDDWWGRPVLGALPRLFLDHFHGTSLISSDNGELRGFLVGVVSPAPDAYIHFVGVSPACRGEGLARAFYERFFDIARARERSLVKAITSPRNEPSIAFHRAMGFTVHGPVADYNGPGRDFVTFERVI
ncbi:GNAT family N-acetyltransferase [Streptosporangiaceae bacterium NEAU-GS5]|nr:GNAT family N-acetyltransferase [Streptosporangiaceae bacterium NEAU-GS5]